MIIFWNTREISFEDFKTNVFGDPSKASKELGWKCTISFEDLVSEMVQEDIKHHK